MDSSDHCDPKKYHLRSGYVHSPELQKTMFASFNKINIARTETDPN